MGIFYIITLKWIFWTENLILQFFSNISCVFSSYLWKIKNIGSVLLFQLGKFICTCIFSHWIVSIENKSLSSFSLDLTKYKNKNVPCHAKLTSFGYDEKTFLSSKISHVMKVENEEQLKSYDNRTDIAIFLLKSNSRFLPSSPQKNIDSSKIVLQISQDDWSQV